MLEEDTSILLVDTNGILQDGARASSVNKGSIHVVDGALAVTSQRQTVGHVATTVLTQVEGMLALVRMLRITVRDHHFCQRETVEDRTDVSLVIESDVVQNDTLAVVEANVDAPLLPLNDTAIDCKRDALWLGNIDGFDVGAVSTLLFNGGRVIVVWSSLAEWPSHRWNIDVNDLLGL